MDDSGASVDVCTLQNDETPMDANCKGEVNVKGLGILNADQQTEKCDVSPENHEKSSCDVTPNDDLSTSISGTISSAAEKPSNSNCDTADAKSKGASGFAFTIDFNEGKAVDNRKYKEIAERLQHRQKQQEEQRRHRRGVSLSKLDDTRTSQTSLNNFERGRSAAAEDINVSPIAAKPPFKQRPKVETLDVKTNDDKVADANVQPTKVTLRRPRPTSQSQQACKDSSKRHSWSPRSSLNYETASPQMQRHPIAASIENAAKRIETTNGNSFQPKSATLQRALESSSMRSSNSLVIPTANSKVARKVHSNQLVVTTPLEYVRLNNSDDDGSAVASEAGTYTLDGDNYTEEEKERMSIDKLGKRNFDMSIDSEQPTNKNYSKMKNTLQVNYSDSRMKTEPKHSPNDLASFDRKDATTKATKVSYLDKIKNRVKNIGDRTFNHRSSKSANEKTMNLQVVRTDDSSSVHVDADHGVFTSITACGVLNKHQQQQELEAYTHNGNRKNSLSKLQIDSSEYIQPKYNIDEKLMSSYTDYEKAKQNEYQLNIFSQSYGSAATPSPLNTDDDNLSVEYIDDKPISIKTAPTKNDWIQEWAKNARKRNSLLTASSATASPKVQHQPKSGSTRSKQQQKQPPNANERMSQSYDVGYFKYTNEFGDDVIENSSDECGAAHLSRSNVRHKTGKPTKDFNENKVSTVNVLRPPISPTKIPSPMHTQMRARSSSANRSFRCSNVDLDNLDTEMYLEKTAAAISSLQKIHRKNNSPQSPLSPMRSVAPSDFTPSSVRNSYEKAVNLRPVHMHKRNLSLDVSHSSQNLRTPLNECFDSNGMFGDDHSKKRHTRHNSYENNQIQLSSPKHSLIDQTLLLPSQLNRYFSNDEHARRSSLGSSQPSTKQSLSTRNPSKGATTPTAIKKAMNRRVTTAGSNTSLQKSASSSSFKKLSAMPNLSTFSSQRSDNSQTYYINGKDNLHPTQDDYNLLYSSDESDDANSTTGDGSSSKYESDRQMTTTTTTASSNDQPISHTRCNKAFLMRMEQNKQIASSTSQNFLNKGVIACPNTPEMPRRATNQRASFRDPTSMPRDSSLSRMKQDLPNLQTTKKVLTQTVSKADSTTSNSSKQRVLPKYMDISKYKPAQGQNFLKRDESKSTLINRTEIRKSPSAIGLSKTDPMRASGRVKSAGAKLNTPISTKDAKAREAELAMWRRRATYDPMKAAAEGRKKQQEDAKKNVHKGNKLVDSSGSSNSSAVLRSQSFHSGVSQFNNLQLRQQFSEDSFNKNQWTVSESSDEDEFGYHA